MHWQKFDGNKAASSTHIPLTRCSAAVALSFEGDHSGMIRNKDRRIDRKYGQVYDPFSPWRVLIIQAYPDWESTIEDLDDEFRQRKHIVNGPEAFLTALRHEFRDAHKRLSKVYKRIEDLIQVPDDFIFDLSTRDKLLFEDDEFTYSRRSAAELFIVYLQICANNLRYFWAAQTLGIMCQDIRDMIDAYREALHDGIWEGRDKIIWPGEDMSSSRVANWRKRMALLRMDIEREVLKLETLELQNEKKIKVIQGLRENLFSGTSVMESRRSLQTAETAILQNDNIRILTLVTILWVTPALPESRNPQLTKSSTAFFH